MTSGSQIATLPQGTIEYATTGNPRGPDILMSHAAGGGYDQGMLFSRLIRDTSFFFIAPSRFGYLRTPMPRNATPVAQADAYAALLDTLSVEKVAVVAVSAGGPPALQFALRYPQRCCALVLISALCLRVPKHPEIFQVIFNAALSVDFIVPLLTWSMPESFFSLYGINAERFAHIKQNMEKMRFLEDFMRTTQPLTRRRAGINNDMHQAHALDTSLIHTITAPTLVVHGDSDPVVPISHGQFVAQTIAGATMLSIVGGDHFCFATAMEQVEPAVTEFLLKTAYTTYG